MAISLRATQISVFRPQVLSRALNMTRLPQASYFSRSVWLPSSRPSFIHDDASKSRLTPYNLGSHGVTVLHETTTDTHDFVVSYLLWYNLDWFELKRDNDLSKRVQFNGNRDILVKPFDIGPLKASNPQCNVLIHEKGKYVNRQHVWNFEENKPDKKYDPIFIAFLNSNFKGLTRYSEEFSYTQVFEKIDEEETAPIAH